MRVGEQPPRLQYASSSDKGALVLTLEGGHSLKEARQDPKNSQAELQILAQFLVGEDMEPRKQGRASGKLVHSFL